MYIYTSSFKKSIDARLPFSKLFTEKEPSLLCKHGDADRVAAGDDFSLPLHFHTFTFSFFFFNSNHLFSHKFQITKTSYSLISPVKEKAVNI